MAFCSNCGAQVEDGAAFCDSCGARLGSARRPSAPAAKGSKKGLVIALAAVLVVGIVIGILFLTGVLGGGAKGVEGTWVCLRTDRDGYQARLVLVLEKGGEGYAYRQEGDEKYYFPLFWDDTGLNIDNDPYSYTREGDAMTIAADGERFDFTRGADDDSAGSSTLQPGRYRLTAIYEDGEDISYEIEQYYGLVILQLSETHSGSITFDGEYEEIPDWGRHFIHYDERDRFCRCDGGQITLYLYGEEWVFTREG